MYPNNHIQKDNFFILTGGPGSGKSALIHELSKCFCTVSETGRAIIQEQVRQSGEALPWKNKTLFAEYMLTCDVEKYLHHEAITTPVLFDRGIPDVWGYVFLSGITDLPKAETYAKYYRYNPTVFMLPPWQAIYQQDAERKQDFALATETYHTMYQIYTLLGYEVFILPKVSLKERARIIMENIV